MKPKIWACNMAWILLTLITSAAYANSSWHWLTAKNPMDVLPYAILFTLAIECLAIDRINSVNSHFLLIAVICLANLASFLLPYALLLIPSDAGYTFEMSIKYFPKYVVGFEYLALTLITEVPIAYFCLRNLVADRRKLLISIATVNIATTIMVAIVERVVCQGAW